MEEAATLKSLWILQPTAVINKYMYDNFAVTTNNSIDISTQQMKRLAKVQFHVSFQSLRLNTKNTCIREVQLYIDIGSLKETGHDYLVR